MQNSCVLEVSSDQEVDELDIFTDEFEDYPTLNNEDIERDHRRHVQLAASLLRENRDFAEDVVQEIYLELCKNIAKVDKKTIHALINSLIHKRVVDFYRKTKRHKRKKLNHFSFQDKDDDENIDNHPICYRIKNPIEYLIEKENEVRVQTAVRTLDGKYKPIVENILLGDLTYQESSDKMGISIGTTKSRTHDVKKKLKILLEEI